MTFLELVNRARQECGVSGPDLLTVQGLSGEALRIANWVASAWTDIQTSQESWLFLRETFSFNLVALQWEYTAAQAGVTNFGNWKRDSFRCSSVDQQYRDEQLLNYMDWSVYRNLYQYGNMRYTNARPVVVSITPSKHLAFGSIPNQAYVIVGEYYKSPQTLTADTDVPIMPDRFHLAIVYRAMMSYAGYEAAPEVYQRGELEFKRLNNRLLIDQLETTVSGPPLA